MAHRPYPACFSLAAVFFVAATLLSDVIARMRIGEQGLAHAVREHVYYAAVQPVGTLLQLLPFLLAAWMAASLARRKTLRHGVGLLVLSCAALTFLYFTGYQDSQYFMQQQLWTAAALAQGMLPFKSVPVLLVSLVAFLILRRTRASTP